MPVSRHTRFGMTGRGLVKLAPGIRLSTAAEPVAALTLLLGTGKVPLNQHALAILELCDGTRTRDRVVVDAMMGAGGTMRATDVVEFLDASISRGWIVESA